MGNIMRPCRTRVTRDTFLLTAILTLSGCNDTATSIKVVVPREHRGGFFIEASTSGQPIPYGDEGYVYVIPRGGRLLVNTLVPFERWHVESFAFDDGTVLKKYDHPARAQPDEFGVFGGGMGRSTSSRPEISYFVGTARDALKAH